MALTVGRPAPQTCQPRSGSLGTQNTPQASVRSPLHQTSVGSGNETRCSFVLNTQSVVELRLFTSHHHCCVINLHKQLVKATQGSLFTEPIVHLKKYINIYSSPVKTLDIVSMV